MSKGYAWLSISPADLYGKETKTAIKKPLYGMIVKLRGDIWVLFVKNTLLILQWTLDF